MGGPAQGKRKRREKWAVHSSKRGYPEGKEVGLGVVGVVTQRHIVIVFRGGEMVSETGHFPAGPGLSKKTGGGGG